MDEIFSVRDAAAYLDDHGYEFTVEQMPQLVDEEIISLGEELDVDHIVMSGRKRSSAGKIVLGNVTRTVLTNTSKLLTVTGDEHDVDDE